MVSAFQVPRSLVSSIPDCRSYHFPSLFLQSNNDSADTTAFNPTDPGMREMLSIATLNSRVKFNRTDVPFTQREILGDATETGLAKFAAKYAGDYDKVFAQHPQVFQIPFNSTNKWALVVVSTGYTILMLLIESVRYCFLIHCG